jgi:hypothetical protein
MDDNPAVAAAEELLTGAERKIKEEIRESGQTEIMKMFGLTRREAETVGFLMLSKLEHFATKQGLGVPEYVGFLSASQMDTLLGFCAGQVVQKAEDDKQTREGNYVYGPEAEDPRERPDTGENSGAGQS